MVGSSNENVRVRSGSGPFMETGGIGSGTGDKAQDRERMHRRKTEVNQDFILVQSSRKSVALWLKTRQRCIHLRQSSG